MTSDPRAVVDQQVVARHPDYRAIVLTLENFSNGPSTTETRELLNAACERARTRFTEASLLSHPHLIGWQAKYASFGCKPRRILCSVQSLLVRALDRAVSPINRLVDCYNAFSMDAVIPIGCEDAHAVAGISRLCLASGGEAFTYTDKTGTAITHPHPGEVIWRDDLGVTTRRWNWRQSSRTAVTEETTAAQFVLEVVAPFGTEQLLGAVAALGDMLATVSPSCTMHWNNVLAAGFDKNTINPP